MTCRWVLAIVSMIGMAVFAAESDEQAVRKVIQEFNTARRARDAKAASAVYAKNAEFVSWSGRTTKGRTALEKRFAAVFANITPQMDRDREVQSVTFIRPDIAVVSAVAESPEFRLFDVFVLTKGSEGWKIATRHNVEAAPARPGTK
jgi:uncharacterized protein (TIGR02246 family)